jgi:hypothetical protein
MRAWAVRLEAKPKHVVSSTRADFGWTNSHHIAGDLRTRVQKLKDVTPAGVLLGSGLLATELDRLDLIDEYKFLVHPRVAGHGPALYQSGLPSARRLELVSVAPLRNGAVALHYRRVSGQQRVAADGPLNQERRGRNPTGRALAPKGYPMDDLLQLALFVAGWILLQRVILPKLGVPG